MARKMRSIRQVTATVAMMALLFTVGCSKKAEEETETTTESPQESSRYMNGRFGFAITPPESFHGQGEAANGDGQIFLSADGKAELTVYGSHQMENFPCNATRITPDKEGKVITYNRKIGNKSFASGTFGESIFYTSSISLRERCLSMVFVYPQSQASEYKKTVEHLSSSFKALDTYYDH